MVMLLYNVNSSMSQNEPRNRTAFVKVLYQNSYLLCDMIKSTFVDRSCYWCMGTDVSSIQVVQDDFML